MEIEEIKELVENKRFTELKSKLADLCAHIEIYCFTPNQKSII